MLKIWASTIMCLATTTLCLLCFVGSAVAQFADTDNEGSVPITMDDRIIDQIKHNYLPIQFGGGLMFSNSQDSLRSALNNIKAPTYGIGFNAYAAYNFDPFPVLVGAEAGVSFNGQSSQLYVVPSTSGRIDSVNYTASNTQIPVTLFVRSQANLETWMFPYAELLGGFRVYNSRLNIERRNLYVQDSKSNTETDISWTYGVGVGMMFKLVDFIDLPNTLQRLLIDAKMRYILGSAVNIHRFEIVSDESVRTYNQYVPQPSLVEFTIGFTIQF
ncbi:MAG: outer membrane beta-barrel protein [Ignavibacteria bacterium]|nr:outer membrane beta-barrel protein [Ignavibacteria bacterium]